MKINIYLLLTVVNSACVPISTSNSTIASRSLEIEYTDKEYSQNIGNVRISQANTGLTFYENIFNLSQELAYELTFDLLEKDFKYLHMKIFNCTWDWKKSQLNNLEYLSDYNEFPINNYEFSQSRISEYVSYSTKLPSVRKSGNYILAVYADGTPEIPLFTRKFMVHENSVFIDANVSVSNGSQYRTHQQINLSISYGTLQTSNPNQDFKTVIIQNKDWRNATKGLPPTNILPNEKRILFNYFNQEINFPGLHNFRFFDARSLSFRGQNIFNIQQSQRGIELIIEEEKPLKELAFGRPLQDNLHGEYYTRIIDPNSKDLNSEYVWVNFKLITEKINGTVFIHGGFNNWQLNDLNQMTYDEVSAAYKGSIKVKQGFYSYQYYIHSDEYPYYWIDGTHFETKNSYEILVYYREPGALSERLVGYREL